eukprot:m.16191 g.16191  ORF g.16191 m.16191 type:complete len:373 (-) comp10919_c0_seq1:234-1352(-)
MSQYLMYVGTAEYFGPADTHTKIIGVRYDPKVDKFLPEPKANVHCGPNPTYSVLSPCKKYLYSTIEAGDYGGVKDRSAVASFAIDQATGGLELLSTQDACGCGCCHVSTSDNGNFLFCANYTSGSVAVFPVNDGFISEASDSTQFFGEIFDELADRQECAHSHQIKLDWTQKWIFVPELGLNALQVLKFHAATASMQGSSSSSLHFKVAKGAGPRHLEMLEKHSMIYLLNELNSTIDVLKFDTDTGVLTSKQVVSTLTEGDLPKRAGHCGSAAIHLHPSSKFLYCSNRSNMTLTSFTVQVDGTLLQTQCTPTRVETPREFTISPDGSLLFVAGQESKNICVFEINQQTGTLSFKSSHDFAFKPVCLTIFEHN